MGHRQSSGFSHVIVLVGLIVVLVIGAGGWSVWHKNQKSSPVAKTTTTQTKKSDGKTSQEATPTDPYVGWKTYTSELGGFSFKYPASWSIEGWVGDNPVASKDINGQETSISVQSQVNAAQPENGQVAVSINIVTPNTSLENDSNPYDSSGTSTTLTNGIKLWNNSSSSDQTKQDPDAGNPSCFETKILGKESVSHYYGYPLDNGLYLEASSGYCEGQKSTTALNYAQQAQNQERKDGVSVIASFKFN